MFTQFNRKKTKKLWVFKEIKARQIFRKNDYVCVSGGEKCSFFGKFDVLCFEIRPFALLPMLFL